MSRRKYSMNMNPEVTSRAFGKELMISPKHAREICRELRGKKLDFALDYLEDVIEMKRPLPFRYYTAATGHKRGTGFGAGRYPIKAAKAVKKILEEAQFNADYKGLTSEDMRIAHMTSYTGKVSRGWKPRAQGRSTPFDHQTVNLEIILEELEQ